MTLTGGSGLGVPQQVVTVSQSQGSGQSHPVQQQISMQYVGSSISVTPLTSNVQNKGTSSQSYVMAGGQNLIVSGATMIPASGGLGGGSLVGGQHHERSSLYAPPTQATLTKVAPTQESYVMQSGPLQGGQVGVHDGVDESHPVSIHVSGGTIGLQHDSGPVAQDHPSGQSEQRLKVEDALNYLDQVKYKFGNQPQVYNDFLDIMKEFKSQSIDTPGVISRVSNLFRGHPELIVGFNTFLPPGYKIEVQVHDQGSQVSYRVDGVTNYVVTNVPLSSSGPPSHSSIQQPSSNAPIIQHTANSGLPIRTIPSHQSHSGVSTSAYGGSVAGVISNGNLSPAAPPAGLTSVGNSYESVDPPASFTHSFSSPFVQNAFPSLQSQPVQFNHAINYVNKIKNRFCGQPDKYKQFLDILHSYQKEQKNVKEGLPGKQLSEHEVYSQVAKIFENQDDLLQEFGQFLPEASHPITVVSNLIKQLERDDRHPQRFVYDNVKDVKPNVEQLNLNMKKAAKTSQRDYSAPVQPPPTVRQTHTQAAPKRAAPATTHSVSKKAKLSAPYKDVPIAEAARFGSLQDYAFFDKCRLLLKNATVYDNFIRCLYLFNEEVLTRTELLTIVQPFFAKSPEMHAWLTEFVHRKDDGGLYDPGSPASDRIKDEVVEIGEEYFSTCKRLGASYCALPKNHIPHHGSGRTKLCEEVLNDVWVSFPTWSEDSTFVTSRKTQYEEYICRCEDERFELDVIIEANSDTIKTFEAIARKMARMNPDELSKFELDETLGGRSKVIHQRSIKRIYGDKAQEMIDGLKKQPFVVIPIVLKRLKMKEEEWRESQKNFNKIWRDQVERFYLKSLDHQGITFKQSDIRMLRSKALVNEIETIYDERHEQDNGDPEQPIMPGPHLTLQYSDRAMLDEACNLLLHHVRRLSGIQNEDKRKIKQLLKHFVPDLFKHSRMELSDDEVEAGSSEDHEERTKSPVEMLQNGSRNGSKRGSTKRGNVKSKKDDEEDAKGDGSSKPDESRRTAYKRALQKQAESILTRKRAGSPPRDAKSSNSNAKQSTSSKTKIRKETEQPDKFRVIQVPNADSDESYTLFFANTAFYVFMRLHQILVERLGRMFETANKMVFEEHKTNDPKTPPAVALRMRQDGGVDVSSFFPLFIESVKNLLDGNIEPSVYEDTMREMFGIFAYISYTMDKLVTNAVRQLQTLVSDEICLKFTELFLQAQKNGGTGGPCDSVEDRLAAEMTYQKQAEKIDPEENCYKIVFYHKSFRMTMELLEGATIEEDPAETTKWSAYIDSFTSHPVTGMDANLKDLVKRMFLSRNIRVGQHAFSGRPFPVELARLFGISEEDKVLLRSNPEKIMKRQKSDSGSAKCILSQTLTITPEEADDIEKQLEKNAKRRSEQAQKDIEETGSASPSESTSKKYLATNSPVTPEEAERLEKQLEMNAKRRAEAATAPKSPYVIKENLQCKFHPNSYKMVYVANTENYFHLRGSLKKAKETHKNVTRKMNESFGKWHQSWLEASVTEDQIMRCEDWLLSAKNSDTKIVSSNDISLAPYRPFNKYVVKK